MSEKYTYDESREEYTFYLKDRLDPLVIPAITAKSIIRDYSSHYRSGDSINDLGRTYGITPNEMGQVLRQLGWTHGHAPFTDEELKTETADDLADIVLAEKEIRIQKIVEKQFQSKVNRKAMMWDSREQSRMNRLDDLLDKFSMQHVPEKHKRVKQLPDQKKTLVVGITDLHLGKLGWSGFGSGAYNIQICKDRFNYACDALERSIQALDELPEQIIVPIGGDFFHVDNTFGTTTKGTPQDMDGVPEQILLEGMSLSAAMLDRFRAIAPIKVPLWGGNHDWGWSIATHAAMKLMFRNDPDVEFIGVSEPYQWMKYGQNLLGFHHGDGNSKAKDLAALMAVHCPKWWGDTIHRYCFTGNLHYYAAHEESGVYTFLCPSLSGGDRWHTRKGYSMSTPSMQSYLVDKDKGWEQTFISTFPQ